MKSEMTDRNTTVEEVKAALLRWLDQTASATSPSAYGVRVDVESCRKFAREVVMFGVAAGLLRVGEAESLYAQYGIKP